MTDSVLRLAVDDRGEPEIFHSIQGEGASLGAPRVFIRLSGCNLHCKWCDTAYTWNFNGTPFEHEDQIKFDRAEEMLTQTIDAVVSRVASLNPSGIVLTGGEPLQQQAKLPALIDAIKSECGPVWTEIETNGSIRPADELIARVNQFNVSPKLAHSGNDLKIAQRADVLARFSELPASWFKFVIENEQDLAEVTMLVRTYRIPADRVFLMPLGRDPETIRARSKWLSDICVKMGYRFTDRLHIHLFGDTRGT